MKRMYLSIVVAILCLALGVESVKANTWIDYKTGLELLESGKPDAAVPYLKQAATEANNASYYRKLAEAYEASGQFQKAADTLYTEADIHYDIGIQSGDMNTYHAVIALADRLNSEIELYVEENIRPTRSATLEKYEPESGIYIGAFIEGDERMKPYKDQKYQEFQSLTTKNHATFFRYWEYGEPFPMKWAKDVKEAGAAIHLSLEPNKGLQEVKDDEYLRTFAREAAAAKTPIFLRFAGEMNGNWVNWNGDPSSYIEAFRTVSRVMSEETDNVAMVWSPGANPKHTMHDYYPGDNYVDWVGVSIYSVRFFNGDVNQSAEHVNPLDSLDYIYNAYADRKPIMISEYAATSFSKAGNMDTTEFAINKMKMLYHGVKLKYPRVKAVQWFSLNTIENSHSADRMLNNYSLLGNNQLLDAYKQLVQDDYYLEEIVNGPYAVKEQSMKQQVVNLEDETIRYPTTLYVWAKSYDPTISKVVFHIDGDKVKEQFSYPFAMDINPNELAEGKHTFHATVYDSKGRKAIEETATFHTGKSPAPVKDEVILFINEPVAYSVGGNVRLGTVPQVRNGRTLVPLRFISETIGADVKWNSQDRSITINNNNETIVLVADKTMAMVNGEQIELDVPPIIIKGTTMVPLRFITNQLQIGISYENATQKIVITP